MIIARIPRAGVGSKYPVKAKSAHVADLCRYILDAQQRVGAEEQEKEKVICSGSSNFVFDAEEAQISEMCAQAGSVKAEQPIEHFVLSWHEDERPTPAQAKRAVEIFVSECGMADHSYIWGMHDNTDNRHIHVALCRVDPTTGRAESINGGFWKKTCQQALAKIEHEQNWRPEPGNHYSYDGQKLEKRYDREESVLVGRGKELLSEFESATSWQDLHDRLRAKGAFYAPRRGGAVLRFIGVSGDTKASAVSRDISMAAMRKRFGDFVPDIHRGQRPRPRHREPKPFIPYKAGILLVLLELILMLFGVNLRALCKRQQQARADLAAAARPLPFEARAALKSAQQEEQRQERKALAATCKSELKRLSGLPELEQQKEFQKLEQQHQQQKGQVTMPTAQPPAPTPAPTPAPAAPAQVTRNKEKVTLPDFSEIQSLFGGGTPAPAVPTLYIDSWRRINNALGADRYRITAKVENQKNAESRTFTYGKKDAISRGELTSTGAFIGYEPGKVERILPIMVNREAEGERGHFVTPLSERYHYILVDDITTPEKQSKADTFRASITIESSPGNQQRIFVIEKHSDPVTAKAAGNMLSARINTLCGDPAVKNAEQDWRLPPFKNHKPKHVRDGESPRVRLISAAPSPIPCPRAQALYQECVREVIAAQQHRQQPQPQKQQPTTGQAQVQQVMTAPVQGEWAKSGMMWADVYSKALDRIETGYRYRGQPCPRGYALDYAITVRLAVLGYSQGEIARAIAAGAPVAEMDGRRRFPGETPDTGRDWPTYAQAKAAGAFVGPGRELKDKYIQAGKTEEWKKMERADAKAAQKQYKEEGISIPNELDLTVEKVQHEQKKKRTIRM